MAASWGALAAEEDPQRKGIGTLLVEAVAEGGGGRGGGGGYRRRDEWEDPLATQPGGYNELSRTKRSV